MKSSVRPCCGRPNDDCLGCQCLGPPPGTPALEQFITWLGLPVAATSWEGKQAPKWPSEVFVRLKTEIFLLLFQLEGHQDKTSSLQCDKLSQLVKSSHQHLLVSASPNTHNFGGGEYTPARTYHLGQEISLIILKTHPCTFFLYPEVSNFILLPCLCQCYPV